MLIAGEWLLCEDGVTRPVVKGKAQAADGTLCAEWFLVDSGADRTVLSADFVKQLGITSTTPPPGWGLTGVGGAQGFVVITTVLEFTRADGGPARVRGDFAAFVAASATDFPILGRDVLDNFDVILSRRRKELLLLAPNHQYRVESP
jgi:hypothetical protein